MPELHDGPELPLEALHVWDWYREIELGRTSNGFGPNPLTYLEIRSWAELTGHTLRVSEVRMIVLLDQLWREAWSQAQDARSKFREQQARSEAEKARRTRGG
jgi:hypothetical protein